MKPAQLIPKVIVISFICSLNLSVFAQSPESFNYQALIKNEQGETIANEEISMQISILESSTSGPSVYTEAHQTTTNASGIVNLQIGMGQVGSGNFSEINWGSNSYFLKIEVDLDAGTNFTEIGTMQLLSVPYALYSKDVQNKDDADADPSNEVQMLTINNDQLSISDGNSVILPDSDTTNELQNLQLQDDQLSISEGNNVSLADFESPWIPENENIYYNGGNVGIGKNSPASKLEVKGDSTSNDTDPLFQVINKYGDTVFAVFPDGVVIYINDTTIKGNIGGFAVSGRTVTKGTTNDYLRITPDSTRIYINDVAKGNIGGFAVSGRTVTKGSGNEFLSVTPDSTRVYVNKGAKGNIGGFAVSGRTVTKGTEEPMFLSTFDSTRIYVDLQNKGNIGGFAVSGRTITKEAINNFMYLTPDNYFIGHEAGKNITAGLYNSFFGFNAGYSNTNGDRNTFMGYYSGYSNTEGNGNIFIGDSAGYYNQNGYDNIFMGNNAGTQNTTGYRNVFIGNKSGNSNINGRYNVFVGQGTGVSNTSGQQNVFVGATTGYNNTIGTQNVFVGNWCGASNTEGSLNIFMGNRSGWHNTLGNTNIFVGTYSGFMNTTGSDNIFIGNSAGNNSDTCSSNIFIGNNSGEKNSAGQANVYLGNRTGYENTLGQNNTLIGHESGHFITTGSRNVFLGAYSGFHANDGESNVLIGMNAGANIYGGADNVIIGNYAADTDTLGNANVILGNCAGRYSSGYGNVFLGFYAGMHELGSNKLYIENSDADSSNALIYGNFGSDILRINGKLGINTEPQAFPLEIGNLSGSANIRLQGTGDTYSYSRLILMSDESVDKRWDAYHSIDNNFELSYNNGDWFNLFSFRNNGNLRLRSGGIMVGSDEAPTESLDVNGNIRVRSVSSGEYEAPLNITPTGVLTTSTSDISMKTNITPIHQALDKILKLKGVTFNWKNAPQGKKKIGLIAQDVEKIIPELVFTNQTDGLKGVNYSEISAILIESIKEQQLTIEILNEQIELLEEKIEKIENRLK